MPEVGWNRRRFFRVVGSGGIALVALAGAGYGGYRWPHPDAADAAGGAPSPSAPVPDDARSVAHFRTAPDMHPPRLSTTHSRAARHGSHAPKPAERPRYLFLAPKGYPKKGPGQQGPLIVDWHGRTVWFLPTSGEHTVPMNFRTQTFKGKTVLTWWQGTVLTGTGRARG